MGVDGILASIIATACTRSGRSAAKTSGYGLLLYLSLEFDVVDFAASIAILSGLVVTSLRFSAPQNVT